MQTEAQPDHDHKCMINAHNAELLSSAISLQLCLHVDLHFVIPTVYCARWHKESPRLRSGWWTLDLVLYQLRNGKKRNRGYPYSEPRCIFYQLLSLCDSYHNVLILTQPTDVYTILQRCLNCCWRPIDWANTRNYQKCEMSMEGWALAMLR